MLAGACGDDDAGGWSPVPTLDTSRVPSTDGQGEGACGLLAPADLEAATGVAFGAGVAGEGTCTYTAPDGVATVGIDVTELTADADLALETTASTCDPGSVVELDVPGGDGAFGCTLSGVVVAAGAAGSTYVVLTAASVGDPAEPGPLLAGLAGLLGTALATGR